MKSVEVLKEILKTFHGNGYDVAYLATNDWSPDADQYDLSKQPDKSFYLEEFDTTLGLELYFSWSESYDGEECKYVAPRAVRLEGDKLLFELEEVRETMEGEWNSLGYYQNQTIEDLQNRYDEEVIEKCLNHVIEYIKDNLL